MDKLRRPLNMAEWSRKASFGYAYYALYEIMLVYTTVYLCLTVLFVFH